MSNQDIDGNAPAEEAPGKPAGTPASLEQELAKERDARALMRDRLRHTEALAAESHALRSRMADELARVTADRDRLRNAASANSTPPAQQASPLEATVPLRAPTEPAFTPRAVDWPPKPSTAAPAPPRRSGPWGALAMLAGVAVLVGAAAWFSGHMPGHATTTAARDDSPAAATAGATSTAASAPAPGAAERLAPPTAATVLAGAAPASANTPNGAVALPPLTPEAQLAAAPTAAGPAPAATPAPAAAPAGIAARLRKALDGEGISAPVEVDAASGHVMVADPQSDDALRDRTDMLIRAVYAGASLPEPQIEHRWLSPRRAGQHAPVADAAPAPAPAPAHAPAPAPAPAAAPEMTPAQAYAARHAQDRGADRKGRKTTTATVAEAEELRPVLPEGRVTANCRASLAGKTPHRADMTACMKSSCCSAGNGQAEDCRAYQKAYPFACSAG